MHTDEVVKAYRCIPSMSCSIVCNLPGELFCDIGLFIEVHSYLPAYSEKSHIGVQEKGRKADGSAILDRLDGED